MIHVFFVCFLFASMLSGCNRGENLYAVPSTFTGGLVIQPVGRETKPLYDALMIIGDKYGLESYGDGARDGVNWHIQVFCKNNLTAGITTAGDGQIIMFSVYVNGFKREADYQKFKSELQLAMSTYGAFNELKEHPRLTKEQLIKREPYMKVDLTSQCEKVPSKKI